ncbi:NusA-like transcription termination signal-binding factor [Candidatus Woesearchaeota archaeon]|nr:NusA-like transcription termination signal-binding factor [Candidatus Woesearchaeota archaeon]
MNKIKYNSDSMKLITLFESMTGAKVRDCIANEKLIFIVEENEMGRAIGKNGANIKRIENKLRKKIKLVEFSNDVLQFVKNIVYPAEIVDVRQENDGIIIHAKDTHARAMLIGRERRNINHLRGIVRRYFDINEIKVM